MRNMGKFRVRIYQFTTLSLENSTKIKEMQSEAKIGKERKSSKSEAKVKSINP